ncbi:LysR family transcriptional regulator [Shewanella intestini]|uniref:LysR family transcriptional regulator n=1 Tax=Shewanella intestini TaxID=2017544 RepID=A0ABS5I5C6_9GAMM|nr:MULTISPECIES: LysR family transcriptional regulator [Shewanella]MBR9728909.1 LysR family transcriptional regulator [Shewanella intestini]MRG37025.1 LysR family transcriptional regulator [Shewanella sp. XMDDZSB0408]
MIHSKIDLNLFIVLQAVYQQGSITRAAAQLHLTQPAVSHALSRLRSKYNDPLFVRFGRKMVASEFCQQMMPSIDKSLAELYNTLNPEPNIDGLNDVLNQPRIMRLGLRDILESIFFPPLLSDIVKNSPNIGIDSHQVTLAEIEPLLTEQHVDLVIDMLTPTSKRIKSQLICDEHFSLICRQNHPILAELNVENYQHYSHGVVSLKGSTIDTVDMALAKYGVSRNVVLRCEHYIAAASVACQCDMLLTMPNAYARMLQQKLPIAVSPLPFEVPPIPVHMYWHEQAEQDPVNNWLRQKLLTIGHQLLP